MQDKEPQKNILPDQIQHKRKNKVPRRINTAYLHNAGLFYLQKFAASRAHFETVMMRKVWKSCRHHKDQDATACENMVKDLARKFQECGLLDDASYARGLVNSLRSAGKSKRAILAKLAIKGLEPGLSRESLERFDESDSEGNPEYQAGLIFARKKKIGPFSKEEDNSQDRQLAMLARAGFSYEVARKILQTGPEEAATLLKS